MIREFRGEYSWLSNFQLLETPIIVDDLLFPTVEHFYQSMKYKDFNMREQISNHPSKGLKAFVREHPITTECWDQIKNEVMYSATRHKYCIVNPTLRRKLTSTGDVEIEEGNNWGDTYWGVCLRTDYGKNILGKIIMKVRSELQYIDGCIPENIQNEEDC